MGQEANVGTGCAFKNDTYYLYFPARDHDDIFRLGVATSSSPYGPFKPEPHYIPGATASTPPYSWMTTTVPIFTSAASGADSWNNGRPDRTFRMRKGLPQTRLPSDRGSLS